MWWIFFLKFSKIMVYHFSLVYIFVTNFEQFKFWISQNNSFKHDFQPLNDFSCKGDEYKRCWTHHYLQRLFWSSLYLTKFEQFKFWISENDSFKPDFQPLNDFSCKGDEYKSCITRQDLLLLFWPFLHFIKC